MGADSAALEMDQRHLDLAWEARERLRRSLADAPRQASGCGAGSRGVRRGVDRWLEKFADPDEPVAIGRFDTEDGERRYIGKQSIHDEAENLLVVSWQSAAARPFYEATVDDPRGVRLVRRFVMEKNRIVDVEQILFADLAQRVEELLGRSGEGPGPTEPQDLDDVLLRDLERGCTGQMRDVVQTIQATQYGLIRSPLDRLLLVEAGPGTGKTVVALHRVSWLLFNHRDRLSPDQVLVVGPNPTFTRYIRSVLPMLGDADVQHVDLRGLGPQPAGSREESADLARVKGELRMAGLLARALRARVRVPDAAAPLRVGQAAGAPGFSADEVEAALARFLAAGPYATARGSFRAWFVEETRRRVRAAQQHRRAVTPPSSADIDSAVNRVWPSLTPQAFLRDLLGSRQRLLAAAGDDFSAGDIGRLLRAPSDKLSEERWTLTDVALLDEAEALIGGSRRTYRHIVVDEAQDLSPMQLRSLRRRCATGSYTVVGDLAQSTGPWHRSSWDDLIEALSVAHPVSRRELPHGYRVPRQIFEFAARLLPLAAPGAVGPVPVRDGPEEPVLLHSEPDGVAERAVAQARDYAGRGLFVGIICPGCRRRAVMDQLARADVRWSDVSRGDLGLSINLVRPEEAKGLEFDAVVVVEPHEIATGGPQGLRLLYVALTRTTQFLSVVHSRSPLPIPGGTRTTSDHDRVRANPETQDLMPSELRPSELPNPDRSPRKEAQTDQSGEGRRLPTTQELPPLPPPLLPPTDEPLGERRPRPAPGRYPEDDGAGRFASPSPGDPSGAGGLLGSFGRPDQGAHTARPEPRPETRSEARSELQEKPAPARRRAAVRRPNSVPVADGRPDGDPSAGPGRMTPRGGQRQRDITGVRTASPRPAPQEPAVGADAWQGESAPAAQRQRLMDAPRRPTADGPDPQEDDRGFAGADFSPQEAAEPPAGGAGGLPGGQFSQIAQESALGRAQAPRGNDPLDTRMPWYAPDEGFDPGDWHHESSEPGPRDEQRPPAGPVGPSDQYEAPSDQYEQADEDGAFFEPFSDAYPGSPTAQESREWFGEGFSGGQRAEEEPMPSLPLPIRQNPAGQTPTGPDPAAGPIPGGPIPGSPFPGGRQSAGPGQGMFSAGRPGPFRGPAPEARVDALAHDADLSPDAGLDLPRPTDGGPAVPVVPVAPVGREQRPDARRIDVRQLGDRRGPGSSDPGEGRDFHRLGGPDDGLYRDRPVPGAGDEAATICLDDLHEAVAASIARQIAQALRTAAAPGLWPTVLELLDEELGGHGSADGTA
ncbi:MAG: hypothetical protein QG608_437 [Actinomycetota bacterium]|nr:hypothetical protein [Actinomycetota bacterium]